MPITDAGGGHAVDMPLTVNMNVKQDAAGTQHSSDTAAQPLLTNEMQQQLQSANQPQYEHLQQPHPEHQHQQHHQQHRPQMHPPSSSPISSHTTNPYRKRKSILIK